MIPFSLIVAKAGGIMSYITAAAGFDISTGLAVSLFGYSFNAEFAKKPVKTTKSFLTKIWDSVARGASVRGAFFCLVEFFKSHRIDLLICAVLAIILIVLFRYILRTTMYSLWYSKSR